MRKYNFLLILFLVVLLMPVVLGASINGSSSIYTFNVSNCLADDYLVGCPSQTISFSCDISNSAFIDYSEFRINGVLYNASRVGQNWYYDYFKPNQTATINTTILFDRIYITDTNGDTAVFIDNVSVVNDCVTCTDVGFQDSCSVYDNTTFHHVFEPVNCSANFNETVSCNFCSQDLQQVLGACQVNNSQTVQYSDLNYFSCCLVTGLPSDCFILSYPYNETTVQNCSFLINDFNCDFPSVAELSDYMPFSCLMPDNDAYKCVVNVFEDGRLLQVNPEFKDYANSFLSVGNKRVESKEFFVPENRLLNVYFTDKSLLTDKQFLVEVKCSSSSNVFKSQYLVSPFYDSASVVVNRLVWVKDNATYLLVAFLLVVLLVLFVGWAFSNIRRTSR